MKFPPKQRNDLVISAYAGLYKTVSGAVELRTNVKSPALADVQTETLMHRPQTTLANNIRACRLCSAQFAATKTAHTPRPTVWFRPSARLLIAGQAPGLRVHEAGVPFLDRSGDRLREWMGVDDNTFYNKEKISIIPMAFCFPGYDVSGSDLPPPPICAKTWRRKVMAALPDIRLTLLIGGYAQSWHLDQPKGRGVTETVKSWRDLAPTTIPLPHPSWRNTGWLKSILNDTRPLSIRPRAIAYC